MATTEQAPPSFQFDEATLPRLTTANELVDVNHFFENKWHFMADAGGWGVWWSRVVCAVRSANLLLKLQLAAFGQAQTCVAGKYDFAAGVQGIDRLGQALHVLQDWYSHHCMTSAEHGQSAIFGILPDLARIDEIDNPTKAPSNWQRCLSATRGYFAFYRANMDAAGWSKKDIKCCVEEVVTRSQQ